MTDQQLDFLKIQKMIGKCTPAQLGSLMRQYGAKYFGGKKSIDQVENKSYDVNEILKVFDGTLGL